MVEIHTWNATADDMERPNRIVWDLDRGPEVEWTDVVSAAQQVRRVLSALDLECWVKRRADAGCMSSRRSGPSAIGRSVWSSRGRLRMRW